MHLLVFLSTMSGSGDVVCDGNTVIIVMLSDQTTMMLKVTVGQQQKICRTAINVSKSAISFLFGRL